MPRAFLCLLLLFFSVFTSQSQNQQVYDDLIRQLPIQSGISKAIILNKLAKEIRGNNTDSALNMVTLAMSIAKEHNNDSTIAESYANLGVIHLYKGNSDEAIANAREALKVFKKINNLPRTADIFNNIGVMYRRMGDYRMALANYLQSLRIKERLNDKAEILSALNNIGGVYYYQKNYKKALQYYSRVLKLSQELNDEIGISAAYSNLSLLSYEQQDYNEAILYNERSLAIRKKLNDMSGQAKDLNNSGRIYIKLGETDKAVIYFLQAIEKYKKIGDMLGASNSLFNLGEIYLSQKNYDNAKRFFMQSLSIAEELNVPPQIRDNYHQLAECELKTGKSDLAYEYLSNYVRINDSIINKESVKQIAEMEMQYQTETKEKEIELLKKEKKIKELDLVHQQAKERTVKNYMMGGCGAVLVLSLLVYTRYREKQKANTKLALQNEAINNQKVEIEIKNSELALKNKEVTDSIKYARRIQEAIFPPDSLVKTFLPESFILYKPKDIVSGDFYWMETQFENLETSQFENKEINLQINKSSNQQILLAAVDCTGHGVPGAFMSIVGHNGLTRAVKEQGLSKPADILNYLNESVHETLRQTYEESSVRDGMDISLVALPFFNGVRSQGEVTRLQYSGANNPLLIVKNGELIEVNADKQPIGSFIGETLKPFTNHEIEVRKGDIIYLFTDGYADQFGGEKGKKFKYAKLKELLLSVADKSMQEQKTILNETFEIWKGDLEQVDDVCVIGVRL